MRHQIKGKKLSRKRGHRRELIKNLVTSLILYEKIITTTAKGKLVKSEVDKILALGQRGDLAARRLILSRLNSKLATRKIFEDLNEQFKNKKSGFTRLVKLSRRLGDNASQVLVELLVKHKEEKRKTQIEKTGKIKTKKELRQKEAKRPSFWDRIRGEKLQTRELRPSTKKTIERTTSK